MMKNSGSKVLIMPNFKVEDVNVLFEFYEEGDVSEEKFKSDIARLWTSLKT